MKIQGAHKIGTFFVNLNRVSKLFTVRIRKHFAVKPFVKIPSHLNCVATLPCEMSLSGANCKQVC